MKMNRIYGRTVMMLTVLGLTTAASMATPTALRLEPESPKDADEVVQTKIPWAELMKKGFSYGSSIANFAYIPQALVLEGEKNPRSIKVQVRVTGQWYWANEGPTYPLPELPVQTSEWINLKVAPEGWVLLPTYAQLEEAAGFADMPDVEKIAAILKKAYPASGEENLEKQFRDQVKEHGADTMLSQIVHTMGTIEIRFAEKDKDFPKKAQFEISIIPGC